MFPRNWRDLSLEDQREWIAEYFMPKRKILEPIIQRNDKIVKGLIKLKSGSKLKFGDQARYVVVSKANPNIVREFEAWIGRKWLVTVFHDKSMPHTKYLGVSNPSKGKWIALELSSKVCNEFYSILLKIRWKYGFFKGKKRKKRIKKSISALSLKRSI